jgi:tetratricopeptide (TPR) repeat protein
VSPSTLAIDSLRQQGLACLKAERFAEAEELYRRIIGADAGIAEAHVELGLTLMLQGRLDEADAALCNGLALKPDYANGHYHLGELRTAQGHLDDAMAAYRNAIVARPDFAEAHSNLGSLLLRLGRQDEAEATLRRALAFNPALEETRNNLGILLATTGRLDEAVATFRQAVAARPNYAEAHNNLGIALAGQGKFDEAVAAYGQALAHDPRHLGAHNNLGNALKERGRLGEAENSYRHAIGLKPDYTVAHQHLGMVLCESGRIEEGFASFRHHAELTRGTRGNENTSPHKRRHDREQQDYLKDAGGRNADGARVAGAAVNRNRSGEIENRWREKQPQIVVVDDLLSPAALEGLRRFCWGADIWRKAYGEGYLGALPEHGFACPLLAQIAGELRAAWPAIFGDHPLLQLWAFKYDSQLGGIKLHADFAAVNVNFWITPDEANRDPESGGLVIWDVAAPLDWSFTRYNQRPEDIRAFLAERNARPVRVPYRANRAVIFDSDLFHETDRIDFEDGYLNRRINVTLLYGRRAG